MKKLGEMIKSHSFCRKISRFLEISAMGEKGQFLSSLFHTLFSLCIPNLAALRAANINFFTFFSLSLEISCVFVKERSLSGFSFLFLIPSFHSFSVAFFLSQFSISYPTFVSLKFWVLFGEKELKWSNQINPFCQLALKSGLRVESNGHICLMGLRGIINL